jgi:predicted O-methyltransferase YrrM
MIELNLDCKEYLPQLANFFDTDVNIVNQYYSDLPKIDRWDFGGVEPAVGQMLYIITRIVEPACAVELGTSLGYSAFWIAKAMKRNCLGILHTMEINPDFLFRAKERIKQEKVDGHVVFHLGDSIKDLEPLFVFGIVHPELVFIDSSHQYEATKVELSIFTNNMKSGFIMLHDILGNSGIARALSEFSGEILRLPTQPNTGFGVIKV